MALAAYKPSPELLGRIVDLNGDLTSVTVMARRAITLSVG